MDDPLSGGYPSESVAPSAAFRAGGLEGSGVSYSKRPGVKQ